MKKTLIVAMLALAIVAVTASAAYGFGFYDESGSLNEDMAAHGDYTATGSACKQCHDVHGALSAPLWRWSDISTGCSYCHLGTGAASSTQVYTLATFQAEHTIGATDLYDASELNETAALTRDGSATAVLGCFDCHDGSPHGADNGTIFGATGALISDTWTDEGDYCGGCHDLNEVYVAGGASHVLGAADGVRAFVDTETGYCVDCHATASLQFPHQAADYRFLGQADAVTDVQDGFCFGCHRDGLGNGVGLTF
ncbi:MAG: hypothetical protein JXR33_01595 [Coriobacteriia bacterium]|nr:hypothetical protein [Coriobacteriia bacterium]